ncbi:hypothetical protein TNCV_4184721 [Trichonephila clavipes]|nr:hypothetical protein TNCV_4184721 [Trichonephila clavipes]
MGMVDSAFHPFHGSINEYQALLGSQTLSVFASDCPPDQSICSCTSAPKVIRTPWTWSKTSLLSSSSTNLTRGLAARRPFRKPPLRKGTTHYKHPCLLRDSNLGPTAPQSVSLTTVPDGRQHVEDKIRPYQDNASKSFQATYIEIDRETRKIEDDDSQYGRVLLNENVKKPT